MKSIMKKIFFDSFISLYSFFTGNVEESLNHIVVVARGVSLEKKNSAAINHVNLALRMIGSVHNSLQDLPYEALTSKLAGKIGTYFAIYATKDMKANGKKLSLYSALGYMSCYKVYCINIFRWVSKRW